MSKLDALNLPKPDYRSEDGTVYLYRADCLDVLPQLPDGAIDAVVTDPPYGMAFQSNYRTEKHKRIANDNTTDLLRWACEIPVKHSRYVFCRWDNIVDAPRPKSFVTWVKNNWSMGDLEHEHARQSEGILYWPGPLHAWVDKRPTDVVFADRSGNDNHPSEKSIDLMLKVIRWTRGVVFDPFAGSGSTLVACAMDGRECIGVELDDEHFDTSVRRIEQAFADQALFAGVSEVGR